VASILNSFRSGAVGFIDWLDPSVYNNRAFNVCRRLDSEPRTEGCGESLDNQLISLRERARSRPIIASDKHANVAAGDAGPKLDARITIKRDSGGVGGCRPASCYASLAGDISQNAPRAGGIASASMTNAILMRLKRVAAGECEGCNGQQPELRGHRSNEMEISHGRVSWQTRWSCIAMGPLASSIG
jgi:hypothetical protein